uniref:RNase H type-1 domain-containing protein n=1 Tax=Chenopodium quinoa TaxID=63459 RepID=A0A803NAZ0_CHEQI
MWKMPQMGYKKLNTDGSWKGENKAGGGGVIRNDVLEVLEIKQRKDAGKCRGVLHHELGMIIQDIKKMLEADWIVVFLHAKRPANAVAHGLAKMGAQMTDDYLKYYYYPPKPVADAFAKDPKRN